MKILHVIASIAPRYGGISKEVMEWSHELVNRGQEVTIFTTDMDGKKKIDVPLKTPVEVGGIQIYYFPVIWPRYYTISFSLAKALNNSISNFDIVHITSIYNFHTAVSSYYCKKFNVPYLIHPHGSLDPYLLKRHRFRKRIYTNLLLQRNLNHASAVHYNTQEEMELTRPLKIKSPGVVIPDGVDLSEFENLPEQGYFKKKYPELKNKKIILFFSRINFKKGLDILVRAFADVLRKRDDSYLVFVGPDNECYGAKVKSWLQQEGVINKSLFTGMLLGDNKLAVLRDSDIFVLPSYTENFGIAVVEAMACGLPVIISNKVNIWREVDQAGAGLVTNCDSHQVAEAILKLLDNPPLCKQMGQNGRNLVEQKYTWAKVVDQLIKVYEDILNGKLNRS